MPRSNSKKRASLLRSGTLSTLGVGYALLIAYGSLFPLTGWTVPPQGIWDFLIAPLSGPLSFSDIDVNILAYIPLGILLALRLRGSLGPFIGLAVAVLLGTALSLGMETLQNFLPERVPSKIDLATNALGTALGAIVAVIIGPNTPLGAWIHRFRDSRFLPGRLSEVAFLVVSLGMFSLLGPVLPAMDSLRDSSIIHLWQIPFGNMHLEPVQVAIYSTKVIILGLLLGAMSKPGGRKATGFWILVATIMAAKFVATVLLFKIPPIQWQFSLKAVIGLGIGFMLLPMLWRMPRVLTGYISVACLAGVFLFESLQPGPPGSFPPVEFSWIPFQAQMHGVAGMLDVIAAIVPYLVASCMINLITPYHRRHFAFGIGLLVTLMLAAGIEWAQLEIPGRTADITDILLALAGWIGTWFWIAQPTSHIKHAADNSKRQLFEARPSWRVTGILIAVIAGTIAAGSVLLDRPVEIALASRQMPALPAPEELPSVVLASFKQEHPRLPAPSLFDLNILHRDNPYYFNQQRFLARRGDFMPIIFLARAEPGSQDLHALHKRLMQLQFNYRGHEQAMPLAVAYDWLYDQWSEAERTALRDKLAEGCRYIITVIRHDRLSPYNVYLYNSPLQGLMAMTLALYQDDPRGEAAMRFTYDYWKNRTLPVWRQVMGKNGGWHEGGEYIAIGIGQAVYQLPAMWRSATGEDLFKTERGIRGFMDFVLYRLRPDGTHFRIGDASFSERIAGSLTPLALEYRDAAAYSLNSTKRPPEPSSWPWGPLTDNTLYDQDAINIRPLSKLMDGVGIVVSRSGWEAGATYVTFKAGDNYWSHSHLDQGSFTIFKGGPLAIDSGLYGPQYGSEHHMNYTYQTIAHNTITVTDPNDTVPLRDKKGELRHFANDGGQRRIGSGWGVEPAPVDLSEWESKREIYHSGKIEQFWEKDGITVSVADITPAYTNNLSGMGTFSHRTRRVEKFIRSFGYDRIDDVIVIFDRVVATEARFKKRWLLHSMEQPLLNANGFSLSLAPSKKLQRQGGTLSGIVLLPEITLTKAINGFLVDNNKYDENGQISQLERFRQDPDIGNWRVEISPQQSNKEDYFLVVLLPGNDGVVRSHDARLIRLGNQVGCDITGPKRKMRWMFDMQSGTVSVRQIN